MLWQRPRGHTRKAGLSARFFCVIQLSRAQDSCSQSWLSCSRVCISCSREKVVRLFQKWYDFSESRTTFWREWLSRRCISHSRVWDSHSSVHKWWSRAGVTCARECISKKCFHFHNPLFTGLSSPFSRFWRFTNVSHPGLWKRCETSAPLRARRKHPRTFIYRGFQYQLWKWKQFF